MPSRALSDPQYRQALNDLVSRDGRSTYLVVYGYGQEWGVDGAQRARQIGIAVVEATKEGSLTPVSVGLAGVGPASRDLQGLVHSDIVLLVAATLALIFLIVAVMLRSPVAAVVVVGTVIVSYASAPGVSVLISRLLFGEPLHWAVAPMAAGHADRPDFPDAVASGSAGTVVLVAAPAQPAARPAVQRGASTASRLS